MGTCRVYIKPMDDSGAYAANFIDVTNSTVKVGEVSEDLDSNDFQLGVYRNSSVKIDLNNRDGYFSDVGNQQSIFHYTRANSIVQITWMEGDGSPIAGFADVGHASLSPEVLVFEGLLNDDSLTEDSNTEQVSFSVLGYMNLLTLAVVPFTSISAGMTMKNTIFACLNQAPITTYLNVSLANINLAVDQTTDSIADLLNATVQDAMNKLLLVSNSVLFIKDKTVYVQPKTPTTLVQGTYYGQASTAGIENLMNVSDIKSGIARTFNYFSWKDSTTPAQQDLASIQKNLTQTYEVDFPVFTDASKQSTLMSNLLAEFKDPKKEFVIQAPLDYDQLNRAVLDRVVVDYPTVFVAAQGFQKPVCGIAVCGSVSTGPTGAVLPRGLWSLTVSLLDNWKILSRKIDPIAETVKFKVRKI